MALRLDQSEDRGAFSASGTTEAFLEKFIVLHAAGDYDRVEIAYERCLLWARTTLERCGDEQAFEEFSTRWVLAAAHWLHDGKTPAQQIGETREAALKLMARVQQFFEETIARVSVTFA